jgi:hypothetical protein
VSGAIGGFEVDLDGVRDFSAKLQQHVDQNLASANDYVSATFQGGVCFGGRTDSAAVQQAAVDYYGQLDRAVRLMDAFLHNSEVMVQAATEVVNAYEHADTMSGRELATIIGVANQKINAPAEWEARFEREHRIR